MSSTADPRLTPRKAAKQSTHERIVASAGRLVRQRGLAAASVVRVMRGARLTVGGFYAHFKSKRAMDAEVLERTLAETMAGWFAGLEREDRVDWLARVAKRYLSPAHRDRRDGGGCPWPAVVSELPRADRGTRQVALQAIECAAAEIAEHAPVAAGVTARQRALATLALCVGGLALARALGDHPLSDELLRACVKWACPEARR